MAEAEAEPTAGGVADELEAAAALEAEVQPTDEVSSEVASILEAVDAIALAPATEEVTEEVEIEYTGLCPSVESRIRTNEDAADAMKNAAITRRQQMRSERASQSEINSRIVHEIALLRDLLDIGEDPSFVSAVSTATRVAAEQSQPEFDDYYEYDEPLVTAMSGPSAWAKPALGATMSRDAPKGFDQNLLLDQQLNALAGSYAKKLRPESAPGTRRRMLQDEACCPSLLPRLDAIEMRLESMRKLRSRDNAADDDTDTNQADINRRIVAELGHLREAVQGVMDANTGGTRRRLLQEDGCPSSLIARVDALESRLDGMRKARAKDTRVAAASEERQVDVNAKIVNELGKLRAAVSEATGGL